MADLSDFKRGQIVSSHMVGTNVRKTAELFSLAGTIVLKIMTAFEKEGKTSTQKQNSGRKRKMSDRDRRTLRQIVWKGHKNTDPKITTKLNDHLKNPVSSKISIRRGLYKAGFHGRVVIKNPY